MSLAGECAVVWYVLDCGTSLDWVECYSGKSCILQSDLPMISDGKPSQNCNIVRLDNDEQKPATNHVLEKDILRLFYELLQVPEASVHNMDCHDISNNVTNVTVV